MKASSEEIKVALCQPDSNIHIELLTPEGRVFKTDSKRTANGQQTLTADQQKVLQLLEEGEKSILELMAVCGYKKRESFRNSVLNDLIDRNIVAMTHPENISHRNQRYIKVDSLGRARGQVTKGDFTAEVSSSEN